MFELGFDSLLEGVLVENVDWREEGRLFFCQRKRFVWV
jgi:hypothetical protein